MQLWEKVVGRSLAMKENFYGFDKDEALQVFIGQGKKSQRFIIVGNSSDILA